MWYGSLWRRRKALHKNIKMLSQQWRSSGGTLNAPAGAMMKQKTQPPNFADCMYLKSFSSTHNLKYHKAKTCWRWILKEIYFAFQFRPFLQCFNRFLRKVLKVIKPTKAVWNVSSVDCDSVTLWHHYVTIAQIFLSAMKAVCWRSSSYGE